MVEYIGEWVDFLRNITALADVFDAQIRNLEDQRGRVESGPNAPELKRNDIAAIESQLAPLRYKSQAAHQGYLWVDPRDVSGADPATQRWKAMARRAGRIVYPDNFGPSLYDTDEQVPIKVERGGNGAFNLGAPVANVR